MDLRGVVQLWELIVPGLGGQRVVLELWELLCSGHWVVLWNGQPGAVGSLVDYVLWSREVETRIVFGTG